MPKKSAYRHVYLDDPNYLFKVAVKLHALGFEDDEIGSIIAELRRIRAAIRKAEKRVVSAVRDLILFFRRRVGSRSESDNGGD